MLAENELPLLADKLKPYIVPWLPKSSTSGIGGGGGSLSTHDIGGSYHSGTLRSDQAPQFALLDGSRVFTGNIVFSGSQTVDGVDLSVHVADANAHHAQATAGTLISLSGQQVSLANGSAQYQIPVTGATPFTPVYTALSSFAGNGLVFGSSFAVGVANTGAIGLSIEADAVRLTSSSAPGAAASILASNASGGLQLVTLTTTGVISGATNTNTAHTLGYATTGYVGFSGFAGFAANGFANTTGYALAQYNTDGTLYINSPTTVNIRNSGSQLAAFGSTGLVVESGKLVGSNGYVSGWAGSGWRADQNISVSGQSFAEFDNLSIRGTLSVYELVINQIRSTNGTLIVSSAGKIDSVSGSNWTFEDPNASNLCAFAVNDLVIIQSVDVNASTLVKRIVRQVSAVSGKTITVTTAAGAPADTSSAVAGDTVVRIGNTSNAARQGVVLITSDMSNSPYQDVISGVASWADWTGGTKTRVRMGNLSGITGTANEYGLIAGDGFTTADSWVKFSTVAVTQNNVDSGWYNSGTKIVVINTAKGIDINASGTGYDAIRSYSFSDGTTYRGGLQAYLNAGETQVKMHSLGPGVTSIATVLAENTATTATAQVEIAATNNQTAKTASISLIASGAAHEVDISADLLAFSVNKIHITNGTAADGSASAPILSFLNDPNTGIYRPAADQIGIATGGAQRVLIGNSSIVFGKQIQKSGEAGAYETLRLCGGGAGIANSSYLTFYDQAGTTRQGYVGLGSTSNYNVHITSDLGDVVAFAGNGYVTVGASGTTSINQSSTTAAVPTLLLAQSDVSEEFIEFTGTVAAGNPIDTAALGSYYGKVRVSVNGTFKWIALYN